MKIQLNAATRLAAATFQTVTADISRTELSKKLDKALVKAEKFGQQFTTQSKETPAGPDTSKFKAQRSGEITLVKNLTVPGGTYGFTRTYVTFLKIGGALDWTVDRVIHAVFYAELKKLIKGEFGTEGTSIKCTDGTINIGTVSGTNWGGIGYYLV